jgi:hypothetical protein
LNIDPNILTQINEGKTASYLLSQITPFLEDGKKSALQKLKNMYLAGDFTESKMLAVTAELCTLDDIEQRIRAKIRLGNKRAEELNERDSTRHSER